MDLHTNQARGRIAGCAAGQLVIHERLTIEPRFQAQVGASHAHFECVPLVLLELGLACFVVDQEAIRIDRAHFAIRAIVERQLRAFAARRHAHEDPRVERIGDHRLELELELGVGLGGVQQATLPGLALASDDRAVFHAPICIAVVAPAALGPTSEGLAVKERGPLRFRLRSLGQKRGCEDGERAQDARHYCCGGHGAHEASM